MEPGAAGMLRPGAGPGHARPRRAGGCQGGLLKALASVTADPGGAPVQATPVLDWLLFHRFRAGFGGRVRFIVSGGAPLSTGVAEYLAATLCCPVFQARRRPAAPPRLCSQARWAPGACSCRQARCQLELWQQREERSPLQQVEQGVSCARMVCMAPVLGTAAAAHSALPGPSSSRTPLFWIHALRCLVLCVQGYGLTETCAASFLALARQSNTGTVGPPTSRAPRRDLAFWSPVLCKLTGGAVLAWGVCSRPRSDDVREPISLLTCLRTRRQRWSCALRAPRSWATTRSARRRGARSACAGRSCSAATTRTRRRPRRPLVRPRRL